MDDKDNGFKYRRLIFNNMKVIKIPPNLPLSTVIKITDTQKKMLWSYDKEINVRYFTYDSLKRLVSCYKLDSEFGLSADNFPIEELPNLVEISNRFDADGLKVRCSIPNLKKCGYLWAEYSKIINLNSLEEIHKMNTPPLIKDLPSLKKCSGYLSFEKNRVPIKVNQPIEGYFDLYLSDSFERYTDDDLKDIYGENIQRIYRRY